MPTPFAIEEESPRPGVVVLKLLGELDLAVAERLQTALEKTAPDDFVVVDLGACEFIDSTGLAVVIRAQQRQESGGGRLVLCEPVQQVLRLLEVSGLTRDGLVMSDRAEALAS
jgi:anti-anti-sigma factor